MRADASLGVASIEVVVVANDGKVPPSAIKAAAASVNRGNESCRQSHLKPLNPSSSRMVWGLTLSLTARTDVAN
jgi:hypothetical protein